MTEIWIPLPNYEGLYEVSSLGHVRSLHMAGNGYSRLRKVPLNITIKHNRAIGYDHVDVSKNGIKERFRLNRLVCTAFNGQPPFPEAEAAHLDGDKKNNIPSNLIWATSKINHSHREIHGTMYRGDRHPSSILTGELVEKFRTEYTGRRGQIMEWSKQYGVHYYTISQALRGKNWRSVATLPVKVKA